MPHCPTGWKAAAVKTCTSGDDLRAIAGTSGLTTEQDVDRWRVLFRAVEQCPATNYLDVCDATTGDDRSVAVAVAVAAAIREIIAGNRQTFELDYPCHSPDEQRWFIARIGRFAGEGPLQIVVAHENVTERRRAENERAAMQSQVAQTQKLESIGRLAAGIAHEINTPIQYIGDNTSFLEGAFGGVIKLLGVYRDLSKALRTGSEAAPLLGKADALERGIDLDYLMEEIPKAISQSLEGISRVAKIVRAMKDFSHPGTGQKMAINLNHAIESTVTVARTEWKYVATMELDLDPSLPTVTCHPGDINQVILNLVINAAHAIEEKNGRDGGGPGRITISTRPVGTGVEVCVTDDGTGIPDRVRHRLFTPFFTTKPIGKGTGQGLALARSVIVDKHGGTIDFETMEGAGTSFRIQLPLDPGKPASHS